MIHDVVLKEKGHEIQSIEIILFMLLVIPIAIGTPDNGVLYFAAYQQGQK